MQRQPSSRTRCAPVDYWDSTAYSRFQQGHKQMTDQHSFSSNYDCVVLESHVAQEELQTPSVEEQGAVEEEDAVDDEDYVPNDLTGILRKHKQQQRNIRALSLM